jgi:hypothetical protein
VLKSFASAELTHPVHASLDHPLSGFAAKRVGKKGIKISSMREEERGVTSVATSG